MWDILLGRSDDLGDAILRSMIIVSGAAILTGGGIGYLVGGGKGFVVGALSVPVIFVAGIGIKDAITARTR